MGRLNTHTHVKLFCEMNRIRLDWIMIRCGLPSANKVAGVDGRAPRLDEIQRLRLKPIICVMASCRGFQLIGP